MGGIIAIKRLAVIIAVRMADIISPVLQQMLKMFPSLPNALRTTAGDVVYSLEFFALKLLKCLGGCCFCVVIECVSCSAHHLLNFPKNKSPGVTRRKIRGTQRAR